MNFYTENWDEHQNLWEPNELSDGTQCSAKEKVRKRWQYKIPDCFSSFYSQLFMYFIIQKQRLLEGSKLWKRQESHQPCEEAKCRPASIVRKAVSSGHTAFVCIFQVSQRSFCDRSWVAASCFPTTQFSEFAHLLRRGSPPTSPYTSVLQGTYHLCYSY